MCWWSIVKCMVEFALPCSMSERVRVTVILTFFACFVWARLSLSLISNNGFQKVALRFESPVKRNYHLQLNSCWNNWSCVWEQLLR